MTRLLWTRCPSKLGDYTDIALQQDCEWPEPDLDDQEAHERWQAVLSDLRNAYQVGFRDAVMEAVIDACHQELAEISDQVSMQCNSVQRQEATDSVVDRIDRLIADEGRGRDEGPEL